MTIDYVALFNAQNAYPSVEGKNVSAPGAGDGTEWKQEFVTDVWGARQALLKHAGYTGFDTLVEQFGYDAVNFAAKSQQLEAMKRSFGYPGEVVAWLGNDDPANYNADRSGTGTPTGGIRLLLLDGSGITASLYPELVDATWVGTTPNATAPAFYRADNSDGSSRNPVGNWFILPDAEGRFLRGIDHSSAIDNNKDPDGWLAHGSSGRPVGEIQNSALWAHWHDLNDPAPATSVPKVDAITIDAGATYGTLQQRPVGVSGSADLAEVRDATTVTGAKTLAKSVYESRPANIAVQWAIRY